MTINYRKLLYGALVLSATGLCLPAKAQNSGDEAGMQNMAKARDQKQIDRAVNGWWTASMKNHDARVEWWREARFGMFIHWGIYSLPGGEWKGKQVTGYAEHLMRKERISRAEYLELAHKFNPVKFNADEWVRTAKRAGMKYMIITSKHHDGFAMYNSQVSDYNVVKQTAWHHDPMADLSAACKKYGLKFGFYYSHAFDWEHPDAPGNDWEYGNPGGDQKLFGGDIWYDVHPELLPKAIKYVNEKAIPQVQELIRLYHPDILWFDTPGKLPFSENLRVLEAIRAIDPNVVVNGRLARNGNMNYGDYQNTADRPAEFFPVEGDWEAIPTTNESYGYSKYDHSHKPASHFIRLVANSASRGGNLLLNIGPKGDGEFDAKDQQILDSIGKWMDVNAESIYKTTKTPLPFQNWGVSTRKGNLLYLQVFNWPKDGKLVVSGLKSDIKKAYLLSDASKKALPVKRSNPLDVQLSVPTTAPDKVSSVIVLETSGDIVTDPVRVLDTKDYTNRLLAFDSDMKPGEFHFGDGKTGKYFIDRWNKKDKVVKWQFRLLTPVKYKVIIKYAADADNAGTYELSLGDLKKTETVSTNEKGDKIIEQTMGEVSLQPGTHTLKITPADIQKEGLMKILEVDLVPLKN